MLFHEDLSTIRVYFDLNMNGLEANLMPVIDSRLREPMQVFRSVERVLTSHFLFANEKILIDDDYNYRSNEQIV